MALPASCILAGCIAGNPRTSELSRDVVMPAPQKILLRGAGATFPLLLYQRWFAEYRKSNPNVTIAYDAVGSGEGIRRFLGKDVGENDRVDFGASDAAMTDAELAALPEGALMVPVTAGGIVLAYNLPGLNGELRLSRKAYEGIFLGEITDWSDPVLAQSNPGLNLPRMAITVVVRSDSSGTTFAFTNHLAAIGERWRKRVGAATHVHWPGNALCAPGNEGVAGRIKMSSGAIGYVNYGSARQAGLAMAALENREGAFIAPTPDAGVQALAAAELPENLRIFVPDPAGADSYPIVTFSWLLLRRSYADAARADAIADLVRWCLLEGQRYGPELGYVALPPAVVSKALVAIDGLTVSAEGSVVSDRGGSPPR
jgi:phosphate transport system substrate-binding protein